MSPLHLRRYRAERLLRSEFEALRGDVLARVRRKLAGCGVGLDNSDLEACYGAAWQGLYAAVLAGERIENPAGWLVTVAFRRAIDEHRLRSLAARTARAAHELAAAAAAGDEDRNFATALDDRAQLRQLLEGISASMSAREREAACLCFLQGLSRAEAARRMGIAPRRLERLIDGRGASRPGVSAKLGALVETIAAGRFCEQRASQMRALAFGVLDPQGERYRLAVAHQRSCPACRAYVLQLRGLAAALPPVLLPAVEALLGRPGPARALGRRLLSRIARRGSGSGLRRAAAAGSQSGASSPAGVGPVATAGSAAGAGSAGGLGSLLGAKLALLGVSAVGLGFGAAMIAAHSKPAHIARDRAHPRAAVAVSRASLAHMRAAHPDGEQDRTRRDRGRHAERVSSRAGRAERAGAPRARLQTASPATATREFGFEREATSSASERPERSSALAAHATSTGAATSAEALREFGIE